MNSNYSSPRALRAARVMAVVGLALVMTPSAHANDIGAHKFGWTVFFIAIVAAVAVLGVALWVALRAASQSSRPRENTWAAWSLILGLAFPLPFIGCAAGPFAIWAGIKAYRMGGSKWMAVPGIVLGAVGILWGFWTWGIGALMMITIGGA